MEPSSTPYAALLVPSISVKKIKTALEVHEKLDKRKKISPFEERFLIPTTIPMDDDDDGSTEDTLSDLLQSIGIKNNEKEISITARDTRAGSLTADQKAGARGPKNRLAKTIEKWLLQLPPEALTSLSEDQVTKPSRSTIQKHLSRHTWPYTIYPPLLLLPPTTLTQWPPPFLTATFPAHAPTLFALLNAEFHTTHIALTAPIPPTAPYPQNPLTTTSPPPNHLRTPSPLRPLHGSFGPLISHPPTPPDFTQAFWCSSIQNHIYQTWAPRYSMFSRGNISEKTRILSLSSLGAERLGCPVQETGAVDLYAGVGYFAFCYKRAGVGWVGCWELNAWSCEGLRRGAGRNGWGVRVVEGGEGDGDGEGEGEGLVVFEESNEFAGARVEGMRGRIPPVRHVNCGFLPSSRGSWRTAVEVLDPGDEGWVHAHENVGRGEIEGRRGEVVGVFEGLVGEVRGEGWVVECEFVERVKSYAPGVVHCVFDIGIRPVRGRGA